MQVKLNRNDRTVDTDKGSSYLTPIEFDILEYLMEREGQYMTPEEIYEDVWQAEPFDCHPLIAVHIRHLRTKIEKDPSNPDHLKMRWGRGYGFVMQ